MLTKFYKYLLKDGTLTELFYTADTKLRYSGREGDKVHESICMDGEIRTSLYIEIEV